MPLIPLGKRIGQALVVAVLGGALGRASWAASTGPVGQRAFYTTFLLFTITVLCFAAIYYLVGRDTDTFGDALLLVLIFFGPLLVMYQWGDAVYGLWHSELSLNEEPLVLGKSPRYRIAHLSDLHLTATTTLEGGLKREETLMAARTALHWATGNANLVLISGDITDSGSDAEWEVFEQLMHEFAPADRGRILFVPGNHDLTLTVEPGSLMTAEADMNYERKSKTFALRALARAPDAWVVPDPSGRRSIRAILDSARDFVTSYEAHPPYRALLKFYAFLKYPGQLETAVRNRRDPNAIWPRLDGYGFRDLLEVIYPMVLYEDERLIVIGLDSNRAPAVSMASSGFGEFGTHQLRALDRLLADTRDKCVVLMAHHHPGLPGWPPKQLALLGPRLQTRGLQLIDARDFEELLSRRRPAAVLFGHLHAAFTAVFEGVRLLAAPSIAYGDQAHRDAPRMAAYGMDDGCYFTSVR